MDKPIIKTYQIKAQVSKVWQALVSPVFIDGWGGGPDEMDDRAGTEFSLWGGDIHGKNIEVVPEELLVQEWYGSDWPKPSIATFKLRAVKDGTRLEFHHDYVPDDEREGIDAGWDDYYLGPMRMYLESD